MVRISDNGKPWLTTPQKQFIIIMIIIRDPGAGVFLWILPNFLNTEHLKTTASSARLISTWRKASLHQISQYLLVKKNYGGRKVFLSMSCWHSKKNPVCVLWIELTLWNKYIILMHIILIRRMKRKKENIQFTIFPNTCNITKSFSMRKTCR